MNTSAALAAVLEARKRLDAYYFDECARLDALVAQLVEDRPAGEYHAKDLPSGMARRAFFDRCRRAYEAGDRRVRRRGRGYACDRDFIDRPDDEGGEARRSPGSAVAKWDPDRVIAANPQILAPRRGAS